MSSSSSATVNDAAWTERMLASLSVERAMGELRRGLPVILTGAGYPLLAAAVDGLDADTLSLIQRLGYDDPLLVLSRRRAETLHLLRDEQDETPQTCVFRLPKGLDRQALASLADPTLPLAAGALTRDTGAVSDLAAQAAVSLAKQALLLPALLVTPYKPAAPGKAPELLTVDARAIIDVGGEVAPVLHRVTAARVPLEAAEDAEIVAYRPSDGGPDHLALVIGKPDVARPVLIRLHSACVTGDFFGSLRCDCGEQLRGAVRAIAEAGGGVLLYLAQEGRGIGIANKLRAYRLQDDGLDTLDANVALGFEQDERRFAVAAAILRDLGIAEVRLLTNNPDKVAALAENGIPVTERIGHAFPSNPHNQAYLETKALRAGHLF